MRASIGTAAALLSATLVSAQDLSERALNERDSCTEDGGNWYCQLVEAVTYTGVGNAGNYSRVSKMDSTSGACSQDPHPYSGGLAPFNEEVSLHFRGPLQLKQFAVYTPSGSKTARDVEAREAPAHAHAHAHAHEKREPAVGDWVYQTMDGKLVSWINEYSGAPASEATPTPAVNVHNLANFGHGGPGQGAPAQTTAAAAPAQTAAAGSSSGSNSGTYGSSSSSSGWARQGYYSAQSGSSSGLTFLNHNGGSGSGIFDFTFGNSLSYASADGQSGSATAQTLSDVTLPSSAEVIIMTDKKCEDGDSCGYVRPGTVAYHGFDGAEKVFLIEFGMPISGEKGGNQWKPVDMPAIWMLNAQIPRTLQYGQADCSCWTTGCGEFDIFEVLAPGDTRCKSTIHGNARGGDSDYFARPTSGTKKAAVVMSNNQFHIKILDDSTTFDSSLDSSFISSIVSETSTQQAGRVSLFALTS